jgi:hypothetical protein
MILIALADGFAFWANASPPERRNANAKTARIKPDLSTHPLIPHLHKYLPIIYVQNTAESRMHKSTQDPGTFAIRNMGPRTN